MTLYSFTTYHINYNNQPMKHYLTSLIVIAATITLTHSGGTSFVPNPPSCYGFACPAFCAFTVSGYQLVPGCSASTGTLMGGVCSACD
jgi:hypothetical protein